MSEFTREEIIEKVKNGESLEGANLSGANFTEADLMGANFLRADLMDPRRVNLRGAFLMNANLVGANLVRVDLTGANLMAARLMGTSLMRANLKETNLERASFQEATLLGTNLEGANLTGANLWKANLREANFSGADLREADLRLAQLHYCDLSGANITGAKIFGAAGVKIKTEGLICEWLDRSEEGDGSDIIRHPGQDIFKDFAQALEPEIILSFKGSLDSDLINGLNGLSKIMQAAKARISEVKEAGEGVSTITLKTEEEENIIPVVVLLANALIKDAKLDIDAIEKDLGDLKNIHVNGKSAFELLRDIPEMIDLSQHCYDGLVKLKNRYISQEINIRDEKVKLQRYDGKLHLDYCPPSAQLQLADKSEGAIKRFTRDATIAVSSGTVGAVAAELLKHFLK